MKRKFYWPERKTEELWLSDSKIFLVCRLNGNKLVTVHLPSLATHPSLELAPQFYLAANPLLCDCHMDYLARMWELTQTGKNRTII